MKTCSKCKTLKTLDNFGKHPNTKDRMQSCCNQCKAQTTREWYKKNKDRCRKERYKRYKANQKRDNEAVKAFLKKNPNKAKEYSLRSKYKLEVTDYKNMLLSQLNSCAICFISFKNAQPCIDHCHTTGKIRGLLCSSCNRGLGLFNDNEVSLMRAADYLKEFKCR